VFLSDAEAEKIRKVVGEAGLEWMINKLDLYMHQKPTYAPHHAGIMGKGGWVLEAWTERAGRGDRAVKVAIPDPILTPDEEAERRKSAREQMRKGATPEGAARGLSQLGDVLKTLKTEKPKPKGGE
jgi:hypothetical protein